MNDVTYQADSLAVARTGSRIAPLSVPLPLARVAGRALIGRL